MLSIGKLGNGQERYYLDKVAEGAEDYYSGEGEAAGQWLGDAAAELGLDGVVGSRPANRDADRPQPGRRRAAACDAVGGRGDGPSPASTSPSRCRSRPLCSGRSADTETSAAVHRRHRKRVGAALDYLQREACWTRRGARRGVRQGQRLPRRRLSPPLLARRRSPGPHPRPDRQRDPGTGRQVDPALPPGDLRPRQDRGLLIFEAHLRHELSRRLGVSWQEVRNGIAEIEGFADEHLRAFSTRREQILEAAGPDASARSKQVATLATRKREGGGRRRRRRCGSAGTPKRRRSALPRDDGAHLGPGDQRLRRPRGPHGLYLAGRPCGYGGASLTSTVGT